MDHALKIWEKLAARIWVKKLKSVNITTSAPAKIAKQQEVLLTLNKIFMGYFLGRYAPGATYRMELDGKQHDNIEIVQGYGADGTHFEDRPRA